MDLHKSLYKEGSNIVSAKQLKQLNRKKQEDNRSRQRNDRFQDSRRISVSPTPEVTIQLCRGNEDNLEEVLNKENPNVSNLVKVVYCTATNPRKLSKQEEFLKSFIKYKENKLENKKKELLSKRKPFVAGTAISTTSKLTTPTDSIVPKGHHHNFRPPAGLNIPTEEEKKDPKPIPKGRQSIYTLVPTPPRKTNQTDNKKNAIARKAMAINLQNKVTVNNGAAISNPTVSTNKNVGVVSNNKTQRLTTKTTLNSAKLGAKNLVTSLDNKKMEENKNPKQTITRSTLRPRALKMPPPPPSATSKKPVSDKKIEEKNPKQAGASGKIKLLTSKRTETSKPPKKSPLKSRLAQNLKAKKPQNSSKMLNIPSQQMNGKMLLNLANQTTTSNFLIQTPRDFASENTFDPFLTSTRLKNSSLEGESLVKEPPENRLNRHSAAKRNILKDTNSNAQEETKDIPASFNNVTKKYNFMRYSVVNVSLEEEHQQQADNIENDTNKTLIKQTSPAEEEKTPTKSGPEERPANYLSPFVSVSRGKVSLKMEKEKRNSVYMSNPLENEIDDKADKTVIDSPKYSVEVRRTLEAVRYFRKQLQDETDRLHQLCDVWSLYKDENLEVIQNANGEDMINVTIGQTKLLTTKKFMQFKGLIDRCESGATGINAVAYDGSEGTKPITAVDLEGFWSMLGIQVDNLEKRFDNLNRWKLNNWQDPDEAKPKIKKNLTKVKKAKAATTALKAKPNAALQQMMRNMRKMKTQQNDDVDVILNSSKTQVARRRSSSSSKNSPRRLSVVVKDRKFFSPAATVISIPSPNRRKTSLDSPKLLKQIQAFNETALDTVQSSVDLRKSALINDTINSRRFSVNPQSPLRTTKKRKSSVDSPKRVQESSEDLPQTPPQLCSPPVTNGRKSILKTPGTAKTRLKNVIFNEKLRVKKFNFMVDDGPVNSDEDEANNSHEEDLAKNHEGEAKDSPQRTITLRNRRVKLRPSSEIVIPK